MATPIRSDLQSADTVVGNATKASDVNKIRSDALVALTELDYGDTDSRPSAPVIARTYMDTDEESIFASFVASTTMVPIASSGFYVGNRSSVPAALTTANYEASVIHYSTLSSSNSGAGLHMVGHLHAPKFNFSNTGPLILAAVAIEAPLIEVNQFITSVGDTALLYIDGPLTGLAPQSGTNYSIWVDAGDVRIDDDIIQAGNIVSTGALRFSDASQAHVIGGTAANNNQFALSGTFTSGGVGTAARNFIVNATLVGANGDTDGLESIQVSTSINTQGNSETISHVGALRITIPNITVNTGDSITDAYSVYIQGAPTEGSNNYSLWVDAGVCRFDGNLDFGGIVDYTGTMGNGTQDPTTDAPTDWIEVNIAGAQRFIPVYT